AQEVEVVQDQGPRVRVFTDLDLKSSLFGGRSWKDQCDEIIQSLPQNVAVSVDIDCLQQWYCPNTGTPVPGGLSYEQVCYLLASLADSDRKIIGFDLVEVSPGSDEWNGNVGARMLFNLCGALDKSKGLDVGERVNF